MNKINKNLIIEGIDHSNNITNIYEIFSNYEIGFDINLQEAKIIEGWIREENEENGKHMLEKSAEEIFFEANQYGCCKIIFDSKLIGFIKIMPVQINGTLLFERGSLFVNKEYRNKGLGKILVKEIMNRYNHLPLYSITNINAVVKINNGLGQNKYLKSDLSKHILETIESEGKLLDNDVIYGNDIFDVLVKKTL